ncbi:MAG: diaminopimelate decarboxylase [Tissierellia bacterium]|nr:diaminopimelate decarboxylase [Tissierellia bacterium]
MLTIKDKKLDGVSLKDLGEKYGTPLYIYSGSYLKKRLNEWKRDFLDRYDHVRVSYASKAFACIGIYQMMEEMGFGLDVVSGGEILTASRAGFPMEEVEFNGNNKTLEELELAAKVGVGRVIIDSFDELPLLEEVGKKYNVVWKVLIRVNPDVETDTHAAISTGHLHSKFGIPLKDALLKEILEYIKNSQTIGFQGLQFHVGSQLFDQTPYLDALDKVLPFGEVIYKEYGLEVKEINIGGGYGIVYTSETPITIRDFFDPIMEKIEEFFKEKERPLISVEPGRHMVGDSAITLYQVGSVKRLEDHTFVAVDGGMGDNLRPSLYDAKYSCALLKEEGELEEVEVVGRFCESGDVLIEKAMLPNPERGDYLVVFSTGAYHFSMANNYNRVPVPPVLLVEEGVVNVLVKGQSLEDVLRRDLSLEKN